jgi:N-acetylated-alpha-linked acidic dipeptidase
VADLNRILLAAERALTIGDGLPGRPWYRHQLYAPGIYTGYSAKTLPGIREAVEASRWADANRHALAVAQALAELRRHTGRATELARRAR